MFAKEKDVKILQEISLSRTHEFNRMRFFQILSNLVVNGIKYHDSQKKDRFVAIQLRDDQQFLFLEVEDNGVGIPSHNKEEIYEIFKKFHSDQSLGSGIGMYIVKKSIFALGGEINYTSSPQGTAFKVKIPTA